MSETPTHTEEEPANYLNWRHTISSWLLTTDHKRIGILYLISIFVFFLIGGVAAGLFRLELMTPGAEVLSHENYNKLFTAHGVVMIFFFLVPAIPGVLGNFVLPIMLGAKDVAFPRLNLASWYIYMAGGLIALFEEHGLQSFTRAIGEMMPAEPGDIRVEVPG